MKKIMMLGCVAIAVLALGVPAGAQEQGGDPAAPQAAAEFEEDTSFSVETVSGEVSGIDDQYISVIYDRDYDTGTEYEMLLPLDETTQLKHKKSFKEIKKGDLISVEYIKTGKGKVTAKTVNFIQSGVAALLTGESSS